LGGGGGGGPGGGGGGGGGGETRGLVRDSCAEKIVLLCSTYTVLPSSEWTTQHSQPWRSRWNQTGWPTWTKGTLVPGCERVPWRRSAAVGRSMDARPACMAAERAAMEGSVCRLSPMRRRSGSPVTAVVGAMPWGVVTGFVGHGECEVGGEAGRFGENAGVGVSNWAMVALVAADAPGGFRRNGAPVDAHGVEGVDHCVNFVFGPAVGDDGLRAAPDREQGEVED